MSACVFSDFKEQEYSIDMYTAAEALEKISSQQFKKLEEHIDCWLKEHYVGKELMVPVKGFDRRIVAEVIDKYRNNGWNVRCPNIAWLTSIYFSILE